MSNAAVLILLPLPRTRLPLRQHSQVVHRRALLAGRLVACLPPGRAIRCSLRLHRCHRLLRCCLSMPQPPAIICRSWKHHRVHICISRRRRRRPRSLNNTIMHLLIANSRRRPRLLLLPLRPAAAIFCCGRLLYLLIAHSSPPQPPWSGRCRVDICICCRRRRRPRSLCDILHLLIACSRRRPRRLLLPFRPAAAICCCCGCRLLYLLIAHTSPPHPPCSGERCRRICGLERHASAAAMAAGALGAAASFVVHEARGEGGKAIIDLTRD